MKKVRILKFQMFLHFVVIIALAPVLLFSFVSCDDINSPEENVDDTQPPSTITGITGVRRDALRYVVIAVERSFEDITLPTLKQGHSIRYVTDEISSSPLVRYEYDVIEIVNSVRFSVGEFDIPVIRDACGNGEIEIYTASFVLYVYEYGDKGQNEKQLIPILGDEIIIFKGEEGIYCCALNSMSTDSRNLHEKMPGILGTHYIYSSHKHFNGKAFEKEFIYPLHQFYLDKGDDMYRIATLTDYENGYYSFTQWYLLNDRREVSPDRLFDMAELAVLPAVSQQCKVTGIGEDCFLVETDGESNLERVCFDEYTKFVINGDPVSYENIGVGDMLNVTYEKLYESYKPKSVVADMINIIHHY
jgi:hypothetical protein